MPSNGKPPGGLPGSSEREKSMYIKNCWYVAAWDIEVPDEGMLARTFLGEPVLLYRDSQGRYYYCYDNRQDECYWENGQRRY